MCNPTRREVIKDLVLSLAPTVDLKASHIVAFWLYICLYHRAFFSIVIKFLFIIVLINFFGV